MTPDVSYVVPAYGAQETVARTVGSALEQRDVRVEVVVADDASPDATAAVVEDFAARDTRVRLVRLARNGGPSGARNAAIRAARGRFVGMLDADDAIAPDRTRRLLDLAQSLSVQIVADNLTLCDASGRAGALAFETGPQPFCFMLDAPRFVDDNVMMKGGFGWGYLKPLVSAEHLARHGVAFDPDVRTGEDFLFVLEALVTGARYAVTSRPGYLYGMREGSLSHRLTRARADALAAGLRRLEARRGASLDAPTRAALARYHAGLASTCAFLGVVESAKAGVVIDALARAGARPDVWPLVARYGGEALAKRMPGRRARARD
ncbi:glycosyltransferase [Salinarimonas sp.]|uniref:glycosyltransferase n=1 Tax=Salinarimonas sp. TaxID=2766526 RepID=UPI0032D8D91A